MIFKLFSQRQKEATSGTEDVYQYDIASDKLRVQIQQILADAIGRYYVPGHYDMSTPDHNNDAWDFIKKALCREFGVHSLVNERNNRKEVLDFLGRCDTEKFLDALELSCRYIDKVVGDIPEYKTFGFNNSAKTG